jgi:hypothetical protein
MAYDPVKSLVYKIPPAMKLDSYWPQFMEAWGEEMCDFLCNTILKVTEINNINTTEYDNLLSLCDKFGYTPNLWLDSSIEFLRLEVSLIPLKIKYKSTLNGYELWLKEIGKTGYFYNIFYNGEKLVRAIDLTSTLDYLATYNFVTPPFTKIIPDSNFNTIINEAVYLDNGFTLDQTPIWRLDQVQQVQPTCHISAEYSLDEIFVEESEDFLLLENYINYLDQGVNYTRKATNILHTGVSLPIIVSQNMIGKNYFSNETYSVPLIKLSTAVTDLYLKKLIKSELVTLDETPVKTLDEILPPWYLDGDKKNLAEVQLSDFKYITLGNGKYSIKDKEYASIFSFDNLYLYYSLLDMREQAVDNLSESTNNHLTLSNFPRNSQGAKFSIQDSYFGRVFMNDDIYAPLAGTTPYLYSTETISWNLSNTTYNIWYDFTFGQGYTFANRQIEMLSDSLTDSFTITYVGASSSIAKVINFTRPTGSPPFNTFNLVQVEIDEDTFTGRIYLNSVLVDTTDYSSIGSLSSLSQLAIGASRDGGIRGIQKIPAFWVTNNFYTEDQKEYIYDSALIMNTNLSQPLNRVELSTEEKYVDENWFNLQTVLTANTKTDELLGYIVTGEDTYTFALEEDNVTPFTFKFYYTRVEGGTILVSEIVQDDGNGSFKDEYIQGTLDYINGLVTFTTYSDQFLFNQEISPGGVSSISTAIHANVLWSSSSSIRLQYTTTDSIIRLADIDEFGAITGSNITSGTLDFTTGAIAVTFTNPIATSPVLMDYTYRNTPEINNLTKIIVDYKTENKLYPTEVGLEDENKQTLVYATFPKIQLPTYENHVSANFWIRK